MSTFPHILPTVSRDMPQNDDGPANVSAAVTGLAGLFADVMAQALSPAPKQSVALASQQTSEVVDECQQPLKAGPSVESGKLFNTELSPERMATANVLNNISTGPLIGMQKSGWQPGTLQSDSSVGAKSAGKTVESSKTKRDSQVQVSTDQRMVCPAQLEIPINEMAAVVVPATDFSPASVPVLTSVASQRSRRDIGPVAHQVVPAQAKSVSSVAAVSPESPKEEGAVAGQPSAVSVAVSITKEAADAVATNAESLMNSAKVLSPEAKPNTESGRGLIPESTSGAQQPVAQKSTDLNGISIAKQDISVNQAEKTNNIAGQTEKVLPGNTVLAAQRNSPAPGSVHMEQVAATVPVGDHAPANAPAAAIPVQAASSSTVSNASGLERTQEMIAVNAVRLSDSGNSAMQVVIKPDAGTQLSLELRQHGAGVQVQAVLQQGDFNHLSQQWPDLQQRLIQRGIHLAPLAGDATAACATGGESYQQKQQQQPAELAAELQMTDLPARQTVPTIVQAPLIAHEPAQRIWETWA